MSRAARRREERTGGPVRRPGGGKRAPFFIMGGSLVAALLVLAIVTQRGQVEESHHPTPRVAAHASHVMPAARYASNPEVAETYGMAAEIVAVLDGLYCYCLCRETFTHYSLLDCFKNDHAAGCDVCLDEAILAYEMTEQGRSLDDVRQEIDARYRRA